MSIEEDAARLGTLTGELPFAQADELIIAIEHIGNSMWSIVGSNVSHHRVNDASAKLKVAIGHIDECKAAMAGARDDIVSYIGAITG
ncbi:hypothetical protein AB0M43_22665 [Longispora sp. NPDC051575]|uniref:hypothetical protein n=1 Tax=Longispora sp. NPDC051575 TaxID=3154943 RepID=UPI00342E96D0